MRFTLALACLVTLLSGPIACAHWAPLTDHPTQAQVDPATAYAAVLKVAAERQYNILEQRDAERSVQLRAHVDENKSDHVSFITVRVDPAARITITPSGSLVKNNKVHPRLSSEVTYFEDALRGELKHSAASAPAPVAALPPPPPPPPAETAAAPVAPTPAPTAAAPAKPAAKPPATSTSKAPAAPKPKAAGDDWEPVK